MPEMDDSSDFEDEFFQFPQHNPTPGASNSFPQALSITRISQAPQASQSFPQVSPTPRASQAPQPSPPRMGKTYAQPEDTSSEDDSNDKINGSVNETLHDSNEMSWTVDRPSALLVNQHQT